MLNPLKKRFKTNLFTYIETLIILFAYFSIGYLIDSSDPILLGYDVVYILAVVSLVTLFYGLINGLMSILIVSIVMFVFNNEVDYMTVLKLLIFVLVLGKFHEMWSYAISKAEKENELQRSKFNELGTKFYALKVSHDQLELNYILKPMSLRRSVMQIVEQVRRDEATLDNIITLFSKTFNIQKMSICTYDGDKCYYQRVCKEKGSTPVNMDPLIERAIEQASPVYISEHVEEETPYLAVIPAIIDNDIKAMMLIEDMPFMAFNEDNLISISFLFDFLYQTLNMSKVVEKYNIMKEFTTEFRFEYIRLYTLELKFNLDSSIIVFKTKSKLSNRKLEEVIASQRRGLDIYESIKLNDYYFTVLITPFVINSSINVLKERIASRLENDEKNNISSSLFNISEHDILREFMGLKDDR